MADLFLSYSRQDTQVAETLAQLLEAADLAVWWDRRMIAGDRINDVIDEELERAKNVIVLWSRTSVKSDRVCGEASTAQELGKLIPIKIEECKLPIQYRGIHTPEVYRNKDELQKLAKILSDKFKPSESLAPGTVPKPSATTKFEFTDASVSDFLAKLSAQRRRYPRIGEAVSVGLAVLGWLWFVGVLTGYSSAFPAWVPALMGGVATIFALVEVKRENGRRIVIIRGLPNLDWPRRR